MKAKKKPIEIKPAADYGVDVAPRLRSVNVSEPPKRQGGIKVESAQDLVLRLKNEAGVL
jgi:electron transfer flavoprotein beta subunit